VIPLNDFKQQWSEIGADVLKAVEAVGKSGWYILGQNVGNFEQALAAVWGMPYAVGVASGLDALELSLRALGCGPNDFVLTSPISAFATPLAILKLGATPVFADCDRFGLVDLEECCEMLRARPEIRYFVPVHLYGHSLDLGKLRVLREEFDLKIVEDCAQAIDAKYMGMPCGTAGQLAATSFYPTKNLGAFGDGGAVFASSEESARAIRRLRDYGQSSKYCHDVVGYNSRLDEIQAAILHSALLPRLNAWTEARRRVAHRYLEGISSPAIVPTGAPQNSSSCWHLFPVLVEPGRKAAAIAYFNAKGISVGEHYPLPLVDQKALAGLRGHIGSGCPNARDFCGRQLSLPIHPYLTSQEVEQIIEACNEWR
jgi:dTDP-3-amino-3,4,6-trideoxy-alpha-D-glucose transaminase